MQKIKVGSRVESRNTGAHGTVVSREQINPPVFKVDWDDGSESYRQPPELICLDPKPTFENRRAEDAPPARPAGYSDEEYYNSDAYYNWERSPASKRWMTPDNELPEPEPDEEIRDDLEKGLYDPAAAGKLRRE